MENYNNKRQFAGYCSPETECFQLAPPEKRRKLGTEFQYQQTNVKVEDAVSMTAAKWISSFNPEGIDEELGSNIEDVSVLDFVLEFGRSASQSLGTMETFEAQFTDEFNEIEQLVEIEKRTLCFNDILNTGQTENVLKYLRFRFSKIVGSVGDNIEQEQEVNDLTKMKSETQCFTSISDFIVEIEILMYLKSRYCKLCPTKMDPRFKYLEEPEFCYTQNIQSAQSQTTEVTAQPYFDIEGFDQILTPAASPTQTIANHGQSNIDMEGFCQTNAQIISPMYLYEETVQPYSYIDGSGHVLTPAASPTQTIARQSPITVVQKIPIASPPQIESKSTLRKLTLAEFCLISQRGKRCYDNAAKHFVRDYPDAASTEVLLTAKSRTDIEILPKTVNQWVKCAINLFISQIQSLEVNFMRKKFNAHHHLPLLFNFCANNCKNLKSIAFNDFKLLEQIAINSSMQNTLNRVESVRFENCIGEIERYEDILRCCHRVRHLKIRSIAAMSSFVRIKLPTLELFECCIREIGNADGLKHFLAENPNVKKLVCYIYPKTILDWVEMMQRIIDCSENVEELYLSIEGGIVIDFALIYYDLQRLNDRIQLKRFEVRLSVEAKNVVCLTSQHSLTGLHFSKLLPKDSYFVGPNTSVKTLRFEYCAPSEPQAVYLMNNLPNVETINFHFSTGISSHAMKAFNKLQKLNKIVFVESETDLAILLTDLVKKQVVLGAPKNKMMTICTDSKHFRRFRTKAGNMVDLKSINWKSQFPNIADPLISVGYIECQSD